MADGKKYYWLKLKNGFFDSLQVKKLRRIAGGDTLTIIYLKLLLYTMSSEGVIEYKGIESTPGEEIALAEEIADVRITVEQLCIMFDLHNLVEEYESHKLERLEKRLDEWGKGNEQTEI